MAPQNPPASIQELADRAEKSGIWETSKDFKVWLKTAERARHAGQAYDQSNDYENAFVEYARAATLILDKVPSHREYYTRLDGTQRNTLMSVRTPAICTGPLLSAYTCRLERESDTRQNGRPKAHFNRST